MSARLPIAQFWHSSEPPAHVVELTQSFAELNPERPHLLFNAETADDFIAEHFTKRESEAFRACGPPAMQADYLRYCVIWRSGGIWADAGFMCVRSMSALLEGSKGGELFQWSSPFSNRLLMNGLLAFSVPEHPFLRLAIDISTGLIERRWHGRVHEVTGPLVLTTIYGLHRAGSVDAFLAELRKEIQASRRHYLGYAEAVCELIGSHDRAAEACEGVRVHAARCRGRWVHSPHGDPPHRGASDHWSHLGSEIYVT